jgi:hypothetical protein
MLVIKIAYITASVLPTELRRKDLMACPLDKVDQSITPKEKSMS